MERTLREREEGHREELRALNNRAYRHAASLEGVIAEKHAQLTERNAQLEEAYAAYERARLALPGPCDRVTIGLTKCRRGVSEALVQCLGLERCAPHWRPEWMRAERPSGWGVLKVHLHKAGGLVAGDWDGKSDPYVEVRSGQFFRRSRTVPRSLEPQWNQTIELEGWLKDFAKAPLELIVMDKDRFSVDDHLGKVSGRVTAGGCQRAGVCGRVSAGACQRARVSGRVSAGACQLARLARGGASQRGRSEGRREGGKEGRRSDPL